MKPVTTEVEQCVTAAGYLENRAIPAAGSTSHECVKTGDYLDRRTVPALPNPVENVDTITFDYTYDPAGNVSNATRTLGSLDDPALPDIGSTPDAGTAPSVEAPDPTPAFPSVLETPDVDSRDYAYDSLNRLIGSETSKGNTAEYAYDPAGNRVQATTTTDAGTTDVTASFNGANQLTSSTSTGASSSYGYDGNGNRTTQNENGVTTDFSYQTDNRLTGLSRDGRSTSYAYDGTGRKLNTTETSDLGSQTTRSVWNGTSIVQQSNPASGTSTLMRDAFGEVALQTADGEDASWALLDGLGTTAAQAVGGSVTQLSMFDDWGNQSFDTIGWNSTVNYTGETTDPGYGLNNYYSRTYDPTTGSWMSQDSWRGLLAEPQTIARYGYVGNNPASLWDILGFISPTADDARAAKAIGKSSDYYYDALNEPVDEGGNNPLAGNPDSEDWEGYNEDKQTCLSNMTFTPECDESALQEKHHIRAVAGAPLATEFYENNPTLRVIKNQPITLTAEAWAMANGADGCRLIEDGFLVCYGAEGGFGGGGTTIGDVFLTNRTLEDVLDDDDVLDHERQHANQWAVHGSSFVPWYFFENATSTIETGHYACTNWFEVNAGLGQGGYGVSCAGY